MTNKIIEPVFTVKVSVSMGEIIGGAMQIEEYEGDVTGYIEDGGVQKALTESVVGKITSLFDRNVLNGIQALAQAEIKDQLSKMVDQKIKDALVGPAQKYPEMTLEEVIEKMINDHFSLSDVAVRGNGLPQPKHPASPIEQAIKRRIDSRMKDFERSIDLLVADAVKERAGGVANAILEAAKT